MIKEMVFLTHTAWLFADTRMDCSVMFYLDLNACLVVFTGWKAEVPGDEVQQCTFPTVVATESTDDYFLSLQLFSLLLNACVLALQERVVLLQ
jgi:hypothetical protein